MNKFSTGLRNHMLSSGSFKAKLDGGSVKIYSGTAPATADAAVPGGATLLATLTDGGGAGGLTWAEAADGIISKTGTQVWSGTIATSGTATWFRFVEAGDTGNASTTAARCQGSVGVVGTDMILSNPALVATEELTLNFFSVTLPTL